jgi:molybdate transport system ATP-binding protein
VFEVDVAKNFSSAHHRFKLKLRIVSKSQSIALFGPSGVGKSLSLRLLSGLEAPATGRIEVSGRVLFDSELNIDLSPQQRGVGLMLQDYALFPHLTVRQNVAFGLNQSWFNPGRNVRNPLVDHWLQTLEILHLANQNPGQLSGGQKQRVALARAVVTQPKLLLLDEPFAALDAVQRNNARVALSNVLKTHQTPTVLVTHDKDDLALHDFHVIELEK